MTDKFNEDADANANASGERLSRRSFLAAAAALGAAVEADAGALAQGGVATGTRMPFMPQRIMRPISFSSRKIISTPAWGQTQKGF